MATKLPTEAERNANLDALQKAVDQWADSEKIRLENEVKFMRAVLQGRGAVPGEGGVYAGTSNLSTTSTLLQAEVDQFLIGTK